MDQRQALYEYLRQKSGKAQDPMQDAYKLADVGTLLGGLSESASMAGQIQGKRAESDIIPKVSQGLYKSSLDAAKSDQDLADSQYKRLLLMEKLSPENRARQEKYRFEPDLRSPEGDPVMMSEAGKYQTLPGFKVQQRPQAQLGQIISGYEKPGFVLERSPDGQLVERQIPKGFEPKKSNPQSQLKASEKSQISALGTKVANQASIVNVLAPARDGLIAAMRSGNKDLAVKIGQGMIKALNSDQGADAVGVEEAARLGNLLEFQLFNLTQPGPMFGRDLEGFSKQVDETINKLKSSVAAGQKQLQSLEAGQPIQFENSSQGGLAPNEVMRRAKDGSMWIFDSETKQPIRKAQ